MICSRKEFEDLCGISRSHYTVYRGRGKIFEQIDDDGNVVIDTEHPKNKDFYIKQKDKVTNRIVNDAVESVTPKPKFKESPKNKQEKKTVHVPASSKSLKDSPKNEQTKVSSERYDLELRKLRAEVDQKEAKTKLDEHRLSTLIGNNIPAAIFNSAFAQLGKELLTGYMSYIEQEINEFCHKNKIDDKKRIGILAKLTTGLNKTHSRSVNQARANIKDSISQIKAKDSISGDDEEEDV